MKTVNFMRFFSILLLWSLSGHSYAQQWYHVELVVFEQLTSYTDEKWPAMPNIASVTPGPGLSNAFIVPAKNQALLNTATSLNRSANYQVHYHQSWRQAIMLKRSAEAVNVQSANGMVKGTIKLFKATYLHAALDLWLMENEVHIDSWSDITPQGESLNIVHNPNLVESRRIRSKKLYFFDHPKMGALLQLVPIDTPDVIQANEEPLESFSLPIEATSTTNE